MGWTLSSACVRCQDKLCTVKVIKIWTFFLSVLKKMLVIRTATRKILARKENREDRDQTASEEAV